MCYTSAIAANYYLWSKQQRPKRKNYGIHHQDMKMFSERKYC